MTTNGDDATGPADWGPFIEALQNAAAMWDTTLAWRTEQCETRDPEAGPVSVVPITPERAEALVAAVASLARRLSTAAEAIVYAEADACSGTRTGGGEELLEHAEGLSLVAMHADAMQAAADFATAATETGVARKHEDGPAGIL
jgi:hypothetical protein